MSATIFVICYGNGNGFKGHGGYDKLNHPFVRSKRCVWSLSPEPMREKHFATFPQALVEPMIKAGCPEFVCKKCGKAREKKFEKKEYLGAEKNSSGKYTNVENINSAGGREHYYSIQLKNPPDKKNLVDYLRQNKNDITYKQLDEILNKTGDCSSHWFTYPENKHGFAYPPPEDWLKLKDILQFDKTYDRQMTETVKVLVDDSGQSNKTEFLGLTDCGCDAGFEGGIVYDPFMGSGTTALVSKKLGRNFIGSEINPDYVKIAENRINKEIHFKEAI